jgi:hypothetical protein
MQAFPIERQMNLSMMRLQHGGCNSIDGLARSPKSSAPTRPPSDVSAVATVATLINAIRSDAAYERLLHALQTAKLSVAALDRIVSQRFGFDEPRSRFMADALLKSAVDIDSTLAMKRMLVGLYSHGNFKIGAGYSSSIVVEFQFESDFRYRNLFSSFSGYVSPVNVPVQMSYSSAPRKIEKRGHYLLGKNDLPKRETDVLIALEDGAFETYAVKLAPGVAYIGTAKLKRSY